MLPAGFRSPIRDVRIGALQDAFLIAAIGMILAIRLDLWATNYPQIGGGGLHIAHLLWGGLFMVVAIILLLSFRGSGLRMPAAIIAGVGFGFFIDELGKFVTEDNNYFFKPAAGIIYLVFIGLFLITRAMQTRRGFSPREYLVNAVDVLTDAARRDLDETERAQALRLLDRADPDDPMTGRVRELLQSSQALPARAPNRPERFAKAVRSRYLEVLTRPWFDRLVAAVFMVWALSSLLTVGALALAIAFEIGGVNDVVSVGQVSGDDVSFINVASLASSIVAGLLVMAGVWRLRRGRRLDAWRLFERALLVQIFVGQFFAFIESQFAAVFGLILNVLLLITLRLMIRNERRGVEAGRAPAAPSASGAGTVAGQPG